MIKFFGYDNKYLITSQDGKSDNNKHARTHSHTHTRKGGIIATFTAAV